MSIPAWTSETPTVNGNYWLRQPNSRDEIVYLRDEFVEYHGMEKDQHISKIENAQWCAVDGKPE